MDDYSDVKIPGKLKQTKFPVARIKRIMQKDEDVGKVAQATPIVISKALELFLAQLVNDTANITQSRGAKRVEAYHLKHAIDTIEMFDFLKELVEAVPDPSAGGTIPIVEPSAPKSSAPRSRANTGADMSEGLSDEEAMSDEEEEAPPPKKKRAPRRKKADPDEDDDGEEKPKKKRAPRKKKEVGEEGEVRKATRAPRGSAKGKKVSERSKKKVLAPGEALAMVVDPQELPPHDAQFKGRWQNAGAAGEEYDDEGGDSGSGSGYD